MRLLLAIILTIITLLAPHMQIAPACVTASADLVSSLADAQTTSKCLDIPAGVYSVSGQGPILSATADNLEIKGAGEGKTTIQVTSGLTLTQDLIVFRLLGKNQHVHDLTISIGTGYSGPWGIGGISVYTPAESALIERVEVVGGYSFDGARGYGIGTYMPFDYHGANQYVTIRDCFVHDGPATGIGINSNSNTVVNNHIARVGLNQYSHGVYAQGGGNLYEGNVIENATGYSFHGHKQVPSLDGSGDRYIGNLSVNPGIGGIVIDSTGAPPLTRYATISGNTFRNTLGHRAQGIWCNGVPCLISDNVLEDTYVTTGGGWIDDSGGSIITGNLLTTINPPDGAVNYSMIRVTGIAGATVANNRLTNGFYGAGISVSGARHSITGNTVLLTGAGSQGLVLSGDMLLVSGNRLESTSGAYVIATQAPLTNLTFTGNYLKRAGDLCNLNLTGVTGRISGNMFDGTFRYAGATPGLIQ